MMDEHHIVLQNLRGMWRTTIEGDGGRCPCCDRWGKIYPRSINENMARSLIWLCHAPVHEEGGFVDVPSQAPRWLIRSNQLPTLRWWQLVERDESKDPDRKHSGHWRVTDLGRDFANGKVSIPKKVYTYNGEREGYGSESIHIHDCFDSHFSYQEVMNGSFGS